MPTNKIANKGHCDAMNFNNVPPPVAPLSNVEFVAELMEYSPYGALVQVFIIEAIRFYSTSVMESEPREPNPESFISQEDWRGIAADISNKFIERYESK